MLEISKKLVAYNKIQKRKKKGGVDFPIVMGNSDKVCLSLQAARKLKVSFNSFIFPITPADNIMIHIATSGGYYQKNSNIRQILKIIGLVH